MHTKKKEKIKNKIKSKESIHQSNVSLQHVGIHILKYIYIFTLIYICIYTYTYSHMYEIHYVERIGPKRFQIQLT